MKKNARRLLGLLALLVLFGPWIYAYVAVATSKNPRLLREDGPYTSATYATCLTAPFALALLALSRLVGNRPE